MRAMLAGMVLPQHLESIWPKMAPWIVQAMQGSGEIDPLALDRLKDDIAKGTCQLWGVLDEDEEILAAAVTGTGFVGGRAAVVIRYLSGTVMAEWINAIAMIERWAMDHDFELVEVWGRPGWIKALKPHGYRHAFHVLEKNVRQELH